MDTEMSEMTTPDLVREYAKLRVWFAVNETDGPKPEGTTKHRRLGVVVTELRRRDVLDAR